MSRQADITIEWGEGETHFRIGIGELEKLQEARDTGPFVLLDRLLTGRWLVQDLREVLRWGLIGGGKSPVESARLLKLYFEGFVPGGENLIAAQRVLGAALVGVEEEVGKKSEAANQPPEGQNPSQTENSDLPPSTETAP
jgi:hypothetical protein